MRFTILQARSPDALVSIRQLFEEYAGSLSFSLCFQDFPRELAGLPGEYAPPGGRLLLALGNGANAGCVAMRPLAEGICEMKRLYVRPAFRGQGLGRALSLKVIAEAKEAGYRKMLLDTVPSMQAAIKLYQSLGFKAIASYRPNPIPGALYLELNLG